MFANRKSADADGHGNCPGAPGHCAVRVNPEFSGDVRAPHHLAPYDPFIDAMEHEWKKAARRLRRLVDVEGKQRLVTDLHTRRIVHTNAGKDPGEFNEALRALHRATRGDALTRVQALALEKIVLSEYRQVFEVLEDRFPTDLPWIWEEPLEASRKTLEASFLGIARVEAAPSDLTHEGTGFLVGERLLLTNRHVVAAFVKGVGTAKLSFKSGVRMRCDFKREHGTTRATSSRRSSAPRTVVGVHFKGTFFEANYAVPAWELYRDPRVRALGLKFSASPPPPPPNPRVTDAWNAIK